MWAQLDKKTLTDSTSLWSFNEGLFGEQKLREKNRFSIDWREGVEIKLLLGEEASVLNTQGPSVIWHHINFLTSTFLQRIQCLKPIYVNGRLAVSLSSDIIFFIRTKSANKKNGRKQKCNSAAVAWCLCRLTQKCFHSDGTRLSQSAALFLSCKLSTSFPAYPNPDTQKG